MDQFHTSISAPGWGQNTQNKINSWYLQLTYNSIYNINPQSLQLSIPFGNLVLEWIYLYSNLILEVNPLYCPVNSERRLWLEVILGGVHLLIQTLGHQKARSNHNLLSVWMPCCI
jgi:hypothetical protein